MKIILLKDAPKIGQKYDIKEVSDGFARNFLFPKNIAVMATPKTLKNIEEQKKASETEKKIHEDLLVKNIEDLKDVKITIEEKANKLGHLFAGIHKDKIAYEIKKQTHLDIPSEIIDTDNIKEVGEHNINIVYKSKKIAFKLIVNNMDK